jgi:hypothetical protein
LLRLSLCSDLSRALASLFLLHDSQVGGIIGIVVGCLVGVGLVAVGLVYAVRRRRQQRAAVEFQDFHRAHHSMELRQEPPPPADPQA